MKWQKRSVVYLTTIHGNDPRYQVLANGTKEIPQLAGSLNATWYTATPVSNGDGPPAPEVEMVEESQRGEREDED